MLIRPGPRRTWRSAWRGWAGGSPSSAGSHLGPADLQEAESRDTFAVARWLHLTGITLALSSSCRAAVWTALEVGRTAGLTVSLDLNLRRRLWTESEAATVLRELAARVDVVIGDEDEAGLVTGTAPGTRREALAQALLELGPSLVVLKLGAEGALAAEPGGAAVLAAGLPVPTVIDPVGAGDAFCAGFIDARLDGLDLATSLCPGERMWRRSRRHRGRPDRAAHAGRARPPPRRRRVRHAPRSRRPDPPARRVSAATSASCSGSGPTRSRCRTPL